MWQWLKNAFAYVNNLLGKFLSPKAEEAVSDHGLNINFSQAQDVTNSLLADKISAAEWETQMRQVLKESYIQQYILGAGGKGQLTQVDYGSIGGMLAEQYRYLRNFAKEIDAGLLTPKEILRRVEMYSNSAREAWNRARARAHGIPDGLLPAYPGDGSSECLTNCKCSWEIVESEIEWQAYWRLGYVRTEHCEDCVRRSQEWNPYVIPKYD